MTRCAPSPQSSIRVKGDATAVEWLHSPIVYTGDPGFRDRLRSFAGKVVERSSLIRHYLHTARRRQGGTPSLTRFFYALRPAAALRWLADHPDSSLPPMDLPTLLAESSVLWPVREDAGELIATKSVTRELGAGTPPAALQRFVAEEPDRAERLVSDPAVTDGAHMRALADEFFRRELG